MTKKKKEPMLLSAGTTDKIDKDLYGLEPEMSLLSVNFSPSENSYLNEHYQNDSKDKEI